MKKLYYLSTITFPNHRAHGVQVMKTCEALSKSFDVTLFAGRLSKDREDIFQYYRIQNRFLVESIGTYRGKFKLISDMVAAFRYARLMQKDPEGVYYTRDRFMAFILSFLNPNFFCEIHSLPPRSTFLIRVLARRVRGLISTNEGKQKVMVMWGVPRSRILVAPNGVELELSDHITASKEELRMGLGLPQKKKLIGFVGRFEQRGDDKGITTLFEAIQKVTDTGVLFCFAGGTKKEIARMIEKTREMGIEERCIWKEVMSFELVPRYMKAMDALLLAHKKTPHLLYYASAVKVVEYMSARRPIIISRMPAIEEVLPNEAAFYFEPENSSDIVRAIQEVLHNPEESERRAVAAREVANAHTWVKRGERIAQFITHTPA